MLAMSLDLCYALLRQGIVPSLKESNMSKIFQVRYTVGDKTVANEHYTEKGAKADAKALSKAVGNAMIGEIDHTDDNSKPPALVRVWEYSGGEAGKPITKDGSIPSAVEILKTADETRLPETVGEKKPKAPKMSDEEKIAAKKKEYEEGLAQIAAGTFVLKTPGRKAKAEGEEGEPKTKKSDVDKIGKIIESIGCTERTAHILDSIHTTAVSRRARVAAMIIEKNGPINATEVMTNLSSEPSDDEGEITIKKVISTVNFVSYLFSKWDQPWRITVKGKGEDTIFNFVPVKIEYQGSQEPEPEAEAPAEAAE
jgi:hypothetical protein